MTTGAPFGPMLIGIIVSLFFGNIANAQDAWPCYASKSCFDSPWLFERAEPQTITAQPPDGLPRALANTEELASFLNMLEEERKNCLAQNPMPPFAGPTDEQTIKEALAEYTNTNETALRAFLHCNLGDEAVDQLILFPSDGIGQPNDVDQLTITQEYQESQQFQNCQNSFDVLRRRSIGLIHLSSTVSEAVFSVYRDNCFDSVEGIPNDIRKRLVFLAEFSGAQLRQIYCSGILVEQNRVVTAKHCLVDPAEIEDFYLSFGKENRDLAIHNVRIKRNTKIIAPFVQPFVFSNILEISSGPFYPNRPEEDVVSIKLIGDHEKLGHIILDDAEKWDRLAIAGILPISPQEPMLQSNTIEEIVDWVIDRVVVDNRPSCYVAEVKDGCILHQCQTFAGFSGAPVVRLNDGAILGFHSASLGIADNVCKFRRSAVIRNRAADVFYSQRQ